METAMIPVLRGGTTCLLPGAHRWLTMYHQGSIKNAIKSLETQETLMANIEWTLHEDETSLDYFAPIGCTARVVSISGIGSDKYDKRIGGPAIVEVEGLSRARLTKVEMRDGRVFGSIETMETTPTELREISFLHTLFDLEELARDYNELRQLTGQYGHIDNQIKVLLDQYRLGKIEIPDATLCIYCTMTRNDMIQLLNYDDATERDRYMIDVYKRAINRILIDKLKYASGIYRRYAKGDIVYASDEAEQIVSSLYDYINEIRGENQAHE